MRVGLIKALLFYKREVNMSEAIIIAVLGSGALSAMISGIFNFINNRQKSKNGIERAIQLLLLGEIERQADKYCSLGSITRTELKWFLEIYEVYHIIGGNGYAEDMKNDVCALPIEA